jgi:hypothetical protein
MIAPLLSDPEGRLSDIHAEALCDRGACLFAGKVG